MTHRKCHPSPPSTLLRSPRKGVGVKRNPPEPRVRVLCLNRDHLPVVAWGRNSGRMGIPDSLTQSLIPYETIGGGALCQARITKLFIRSPEKAAALQQPPRKVL